MNHLIQLLVVLMFYVDCFSSEYNLLDPWSVGADSSEYVYKQQQQNNYNENYKNDNSQNNKDSLDNAKIYAQYFLIPDYKPLKEGFNTIGESLYDYINEHLIKKYPGKDDNQKYLFIPYINEVIEQAQRHLAENLHRSFVVGMYQAIDQNSFENIQDPKFQYVMKYSNSWMNPIVKEWVKRENYDFKDINKNSPRGLYEEPLFIYAIKKNADMILRFFIDNIGININEEPADWQQKILFKAVACNADRAAQLFIEKGADIKNKGLMLPVCYFSSDKVAKVFIDAGIDVNELSSEGLTPLDYLLSNTFSKSDTKENQNIIKMIRDAGAEGTELSR